MNIKILDSWLREYLKTSATPKKIAEKLSLTSVSIERIENYKNDFVYDIEITTNRPDLMSVVGIAQEAATVLPQSGIDATFVKPKLDLPTIHPKKSPELTLKFDEKLVNRICAVIMEVKIVESPDFVKDRLDASGIRSLNNVIDITNYVMREIGHPTHVFDYDRLLNHTLIIRESKKGEKMRTLDEKEYTLSGGDIVADNGKGEIIDLISIMGTANSVVTNNTKRILFFIDNVEPTHIRKTSMEHGIRTEAAILNEKGINPESVNDALARGIELFQTLANGEIMSEIIDYYPNKPKEIMITLSEKKINDVVGINIPIQKSVAILTSLGFMVERQGETLIVTVPHRKSGEDMLIPEDLIEEIARVYGYDNIPDTLPASSSASYIHLDLNEFYWEDRIKDALKYWGFTEVYTYPMVSETMFEGPIEDAVTIQNPLTDDMVYMRRTLVPNLLQVAKENQDHEIIKIFELANIYEKNGKNLPKQNLKLAGLLKKPKASFLEMKGVIEQLLADLEIKNATFKPLTDRSGALVLIDKQELGVIEIFDDTIITFELDIALLLQQATRKKIYTPVSKYPSVIEDLAIIAPTTVQTGDLMDAIKKQNTLIRKVSLIDKYKETRTFHIVYQSYDKNLTDKEIGEIRKTILKTLKDKYYARLK
ncbi:MAG TPA: phenylalanine--tRNA ligase subunit beta [Candidatus Sulfotelmatobacter sp.]|jgi:phenylalanyl-tRNA synthetase beta chain|nr:phenylalanine--tRNA ligase subunit beta [Candidatus Sulfotelmatobacter sp.]